MSSSFSHDGPVTYVTRQPPKYEAGVTFRMKAQSTGVGEELQFNPEYFGTTPGILKIVQLILAIIALCCISPPVTWFARLLTFCIALPFALTILLCFAYLICLQRALFPTFNWILAELVFTSVAAIGLMISSLVHIAYSCRSDYRYSLTYHSSYLGSSIFGAYIAAGLFAILLGAAYAAGAHYLQRDFKNGIRVPAPVKEY